MDAYTFLIAFFAGAPPGYFIELTYIHGDKTLGLHPIIEFVEVGNRTQMRDALERAAEYNRQGYGVYFGACPRKSLPPRGKRGSESHVDTIMGFYTELDSVKEGRQIESDLQMLQSAVFVPSFCILSGGGVHAYWLLEQPYTMPDDKRQLIKSALRGIGEKFGGDLGVAEFARVLRLPGFVNTKPERGSSPVTFVSPAEKHRYSIDQLLAFAPAERPKPQRKTYRYAVTDAMELVQAAMKALAPHRFTDYAEWIEVGLCLTDLGPTGVQLWDEYSSKYPNYESGICEKMAKGFRNEVHLASLYRLADIDSGTSWRPKPPQPFTVSNSLEILQTENQPSIDYWPTGLPISLRSTLMTYAHPAVAPTLELWCEGIAAGIIPGREITTVQCLLKVAKELKRNVSETTIRTGLNQGCVQFLRILSQNSISMEESLIQDKITVTESEGSVRGESDDCDCPCKNPLRAGREATYYELLTPKEILINAAKLAIVPILLKAFPPSDGLVAPIRAEFLNLLGLEKADELSAELTKRYQATLESQPGYQAAMDQARLEYKRLAKALANPESAPIPAGMTYQNSAQYMAVCARAIIERDGGETHFSRATWCNKIGCTDRNLTAIFKRAGIRVIKEQTIELPIKCLDQLKAMAPTYNRDAQGFPKAVVSSAKPEQPYGFTKKGMIAWAEGELAIGATLSVRYRQANRQTIQPDETPVIEQPKKRLTHSQIVALRLIIAYVIDNMVADEKLPPSLRGERPVFEPDVLWRWHRLQRTSYMLAWYRWRMRPDVEIWAEQAAQKLSAWKVRGSTMVDTSAGEIRQFTPQAAIEVLAEPDVSPPIAPPENIPKSVDYGCGAELFSKWQSFADLDRRDDWYAELPGADKLALIEYRYSPTPTDKNSLTVADDPLVSALLSRGGVVSSVEYREAEPVAA